LLDTLRACFARLPDARREANAIYTMAEIGLAAFSVFFLQSPSFLAHQRQLQEGQERCNLSGLFGLTRIPSDNHIRAMLDPADPALLHPAFASVVAGLDGTELFRSAKVGCPNCSTRRRGNGQTECYLCDLAKKHSGPREGWDQALILPEPRRPHRGFLPLPTWEDLLQTLAFAEPTP